MQNIIIRNRFESMHDPRYRPYFPNDRAHKCSLCRLSFFTQHYIELKYITRIYIV